MSRCWDLSFVELMALGPCATRKGFVRTYFPRDTRVNAKQARALGFTLNDFAWLAARLSIEDPEIERRFRHWMLDCAVCALKVVKFGPDQTKTIADAVSSLRLAINGESDFSPVLNSTLKARRDAAAANGDRSRFDALAALVCAAHTGDKHALRTTRALTFNSYNSAVILTCHSRYCLNRLGGDDYDVMAQQCDRLVEWLSPDAPKSLNYYKSGKGHGRNCEV